MKWEEVVNVFRRIRYEGIPIQLGVNSLLLSPWIPNRDDNGWRLRIVQKILSSYLNYIDSISQDFDLNTRIIEFETEKYLEIYKAGYDDPVHHLKPETITPDPLMVTVA